MDGDAVEVRVVGCLLEKQRTERLHGFADLAAVDETLEKLVERGYAERLPRRRGQREQRYRHLLGDPQA